MKRDSDSAFYWGLWDYGGKILEGQLEKEVKGLGIGA